MGMYTGLRASVVVKPQWRDAIALLHHANQDENHPENKKFESGYDWNVVLSRYPDIPGVAGWVGFDRRDFIPFGALAYMPDDFSDAEDRESYSEFDVETGRWRFCCSLKNYEGEIEFFVENVLAYIVESVEYCESLYEEYPWDEEPDWRRWTTKWLRGV